MWISISFFSTPNIVLPILTRMFLSAHNSITLLTSLPSYIYAGDGYAGFGGFYLAITFTLHTPLTWNTLVIARIFCCLTNLNFLFGLNLFRLVNHKFTKPLYRLAKVRTTVAFLVPLNHSIVMGNHLVFFEGHIIWSQLSYLIYCELQLFY